MIHHEPGIALTYRPSGHFARFHVAPPSHLQIRRPDFHQFVTVYSITFSHRITR